MHLSLPLPTDNTRTEPAQWRTGVGGGSCPALCSMLLPLGAVSQEIGILLTSPPPPPAYLYAPPVSGQEQLQSIRNVLNSWHENLYTNYSHRAIS